MTGLQTQVFDDLAALTQSAAQRVVELAGESIAARGRFLWALSGGGTPRGVYKLLADAAHHDQVDWRRVHFFWGDERCVPVADPENSYGQAKADLLDHLRVDWDNVHRVDSDLEPGRGAEAYGRTLNQFADAPLAWPRFDLTFLGLGDDGHTASLFPGSSIDAEAPAIAVEANYQGRPARRVTLTPQVFNSSRNIFFLVSGASKADALKEVLQGRRDLLQWPAQRISPTDGKFLWLVDRDAARALS